jgi:Ribosomal protein L11 methyltransferase (PrmA)/Arginine methyltransferase oligomerization subdomain
MNVLKASTVLRRTPGVEIHLDSTAEVRVVVDGQGGTYLGHCLAVLNVFAQPTSVQEAMTQLRTSGVQDWMDLSSTINRLFQAGALRLESDGDAVAPELRSGFDAPPIHIAMLNDRSRTEGFLRAISETVQPGDVVIDIGTGTGILAVAAARAGAARVYAIEAGEMGDIAEQVFHASDTRERLELVRGWSTSIELPERADVLISEIIGCDPFAERVLAATLDARRRLLKPGARYVPRNISVYGLAVTIPSSRVATLAFTEEAVENWRGWYGVDFGCLVQGATAGPQRFEVPAGQAASWLLLSNATRLARVDLTRFQDTVIDEVVDLETVKSGTLNGVLLFFELQIGSGSITTHPSQQAADNHWRNPVWYFPERTVEAGNRIRVQYKYSSGSHSEVRIV